MAITAGEAIEMLRAAGEPTRLRVLALLSREELSVLEIGRILGQSQPRVSRHLKLLTEAGLAERFADGAWAFYRLAPQGAGRGFVEATLALAPADDPLFATDLSRLAEVRRERRLAAAEYFARNAPRWGALRSLHTDEAEVEAAVLAAAGPGPFRRLVDLGTGTGRMLRLLAPRARQALGLDLSQSMLNLARSEAEGADLAHVELRHGDILGTGLPEASADLVVVHQVLHYLGEPQAAVAEAARLLEPGGRLLIVDFAPHAREHLRDEHRHRRLGFSDEEMSRWMEGAGLCLSPVSALPPTAGEGLTVKIWSAARRRVGARTAA